MSAGRAAPTAGSTDAGRERPTPDLPERAMITPTGERPEVCGSCGCPINGQTGECAGCS